MSDNVIVSLTAGFYTDQSVRDENDLRQMRCDDRERKGCGLALLVRWGLGRQRGGEGSSKSRENTDAEATGVGERLVHTDWDARKPDEMETFIHLYLGLIVSRVLIHLFTLHGCIFYFMPNFRPEKSLLFPHRACAEEGT